MDNTCPSIDHGPEIHGENAVSIAAMLEYLLSPNHPMHSEAVEMAHRFIDCELNRKRSMAPSPFPHYDPNEWDN